MYLNVFFILKYPGCRLQKLETALHFSIVTLSNCICNEVTFECLVFLRRLRCYKSKTIIVVECNVYLGQGKTTAPCIFRWVMVRPKNDTLFMGQSQLVLPNWRDTLFSLT